MKETLESKKNIAFHIPFYDGDEINRVIEALKSKNIVGMGEFTKKLEEEFANHHKVKYAFLVTSCTMGLEIALKALGVKKDDEVIIPDFTFCSDVAVIRNCGANPILVDVEPNTGNLDIKQLKKAISDTTKVIMPTHYASQPCDMEKIIDIAKKQGIHIVEDCAQAVDVKYKGKFLGSFGDIGVYSFHGTKNITSGQGGMIVTNNKILASKIEKLRDSGTNRQDFLRGEVKFYEMVMDGYNAILPEYCAAFLLENFKKREKIKNARKELAEFYLKELKDVRGINLPKEFKNCERNQHIFFILVDREKRDDFIKELKKEGINASAHYLPLHKHKIMEGKFKDKDFKNSNKFADSIVRLPLYPDLSKDEASYVVNAVKKVASDLM